MFRQGLGFMRSVQGSGKILRESLYVRQVREPTAFHSRAHAPSMRKKIFSAPTRSELFTPFQPSIDFP